MLGFTGDGFWAHLAACASRDEISPDPTMEHRTSDVLTAIIIIIIRAFVRRTMSASELNLRRYMNTSSINTGTF